MYIDTKLTHAQTKHQNEHFGVGRAQTKTVVERLTQTMVLNHYLEEDSTELASGFSANYVNVRASACVCVCLHGGVLVICV